MAQRLSPSPPRGKVQFPLVGGKSRWRTRVLKGIRALLLRARLPLLWVSVLAEAALLLIALVPQSIWANYGYPAGPIPNAFAPVVAGAFYLLPLVAGLLCRRWPVAIILATFPALLDLGVFAIAAAKRIGPFYLVQDPHTANTVSTLELFSILGLLGWLGRCWLLELLGTGTREP